MEAGTQPPRHNVLILVEGNSSLTNLAMGDGRQLANLLGHFETTTVIEGISSYRRHTLDRYDIIFYIGFHAHNVVPDVFLSDVLTTSKPVVWIHTGFIEFSRSHDLLHRIGFAVQRLDSTGGYDRIRHGRNTFTKDEPIINVVTLNPKMRVEILATAVSSRRHKDLPYIVRSGHLTYISDSPFASASATDRYLLFADMLHEMLAQPHEESHSAMIRIEDVNPMENPENLRNVADILSERGIPFLVGVSPYYVNPGEGLRISLSEKPEVVDALKYMVRNGGTIVMHGVTHQYKGVTGADFEFWDEETNKPIKDETTESIVRKLEAGIDEFSRNGLYPLVWETPHYTASFRLYRTIPAFFNTAMEQRLAIEDFDYSQFFPYIIEKDLFGQVLYPENLGYVPLDSDRVRNEASIRQIVDGARANLAVRDGFAASFFHAFNPPELLAALVDSIQHLGYTYIDLKDRPLRVTSRDHVFLTGSQSFQLDADGKFLVETTFDSRGEVIDRRESENRIVGTITKSVNLVQGQFYVAELAEIKRSKPSLTERIVEDVTSAYETVFASDPSWSEARPVILWNHHARGGAYNDQASFAAALRSVNIRVDTIFVGDSLDLSPYNLVIVPYCFVDSLQDHDFDILTGYVERGGNLITDARNELAEEFGIRFSESHLRVSNVYDNAFPEERVTWRVPELISKFDADRIDKIFCTDLATEFPLVIGRKFGTGNVMYIASRFDPHTQLGTSHYPFLIEYIRTYFRLGPIVRSDRLEVYFDPGFRHSQSIEYLVRQWLSLGIRFIHVAGWHEYPKYTYDYKRLLDLAHAHGMLVFLWIEPPQVSLKFWQDHPGWREKNYLGADVRPSWRYPVALTDSACLVAVTDEYRKLIRSQAWDGVNLAELYFEAGRGLSDPNLYTPMHPSARKEILKLYGFDPWQVFDSTSATYWKTNEQIRSSLQAYRIRKLDEAYGTFLEMIRDAGKDIDGFQIIVTAMDSHGSPELREHIGVDMDHILALQRRYGFLLQVEDPQSRWSEDPTRYTNIGAAYAEQLGGSSSLLLDLNILSFRKPEEITPFPTLIQTGTEAFHLVRSAALGAPRLTIYSESSVNPQDLRYFANALATDVEYSFHGSTIECSSPRSFVLRLPKAISEIQIDGQPMVAVRDNCFLIPAGRHLLTESDKTSGSFSTHRIQPRILSFTGNILSAEYGMRSVALEYTCDTRALISLNSEPTAMTVDGNPAPLVALKGDDCYSIFLPTGSHRVSITTGDLVTYGVNLTSLWSTTAIAMFGTIGVALLAAMYLSSIIIRRRAIRERSAQR